MTREASTIRAVERAVKGTRKAACVWGELTSNLPLTMGTDLIFLLHPAIIITWNLSSLQTFARVSSAVITPTTVL